VRAQAPERGPRPERQAMDGVSEFASDEDLAASGCSADQLPSPREPSGLAALPYLSTLSSRLGSPR
jgi:hypothetical protein